MAVLHERPEAGVVQSQQPGTRLRRGVGSGRIGLTGGLGQLLAQAQRQPLHLGRLGEPQRPAVGGIQQAIAKASGEFRQLLAGGVEGQPLGSGQPDTTPVHVAQLGRQDALLGGVQIRACLQRFQRPIENFALAGAIAEGHHGRLLCGMGLAQFRRVADAIEMAHHPPAPAQPFIEPMQGLHHRWPVRRLSAAVEVCEPGFKRGELVLQFGHQLGNVLTHLLWCDQLELGQPGAGQQGGSALEF